MSPMAINEITASQLLDLKQPLDISLLDAVVDCMYAGFGPEQKMAEKILTTLKEHPEAWTRVDTILECSNNQQTKYFALQILENVIKTKWKVLPREQCEGIKKFIVGLIIKTSSSISIVEGEKVYLGKLNMILVQILKHEWPKNWPTFIEDIVGSSKSNESLCQNNMVIMKLLSEEVFDFSMGQMTQTKIKHLKDSMCNEFSNVFSLCQYVLLHSENAVLVVSTLETLLKFMHWIPLGYIFETQLILTLIVKFLNVPMFRNVTLQCLTEIANVSASEYKHVFVDLFCKTTTVLKEMLLPTTNINSVYMYGQDDEQKFIQNLSMFYSSLFMNHLKTIESNESLHPLLNDAFEYLLNISEVEETEIFKICLELWNHIVADLYKLDQESNFNLMAHNDITAKNRFYAPILKRLRKIMISRMARPEEVLVVENEQGEVVREFMKDTDSINLYKNMRECLVYLTHLDYHDTEMIMTEKLRHQTDGSEWSWKNLNTLCWAIGSISGSMNEDDERRFLVIAIRDLLGLCEQKRGKDNKAIVASNIMYVVGQYPRFLKAHWRFLKTVITKLFEFMHETHDGVQDMACDTFIKIAQKCRRQFVTLQSGEMYTFVDEILSGLNNIISDLSSQQVHTFYEAMGMVVAAETDPVVQEKDAVISELSDELKKERDYRAMECAAKMVLQKQLESQTGAIETLTRQVKMSEHPVASVELELGRCKASEQCSVDENRLRRDTDSQLQRELEQKCAENRQLVKDNLRLAEELEKINISSDASNSTLKILRGDVEERSKRVDKANKKREKLVHRYKTEKKEMKDTIKDIIQEKESLTRTAELLQQREILAASVLSRLRSEVKRILFNEEMSVFCKAGDSAKSGMAKLGGKNESTSVGSHCEKLIKEVFQLKNDPAIVFSFSKQSCETYARLFGKLNYSNKKVKDNIKLVFENARNTLLEELRWIIEVADGKLVCVIADLDGSDAMYSIIVHSSASYRRMPTVNSVLCGRTLAIVWRSYSAILDVSMKNADITVTQVSVTRIKVAVIRGEESHGDKEMVAAFIKVGFEIWEVEMQDLLSGTITLDVFGGAACEGGFNFGYVLGSVDGWAASIKCNYRISEQFEHYRKRADTFSLVVCNVDQLMVRMSWLADFSEWVQGMCDPVNRLKRLGECQCHGLGSDGGPS